MEDLLVDTYFWFDKRPVRKEDYRDYQAFTDTATGAIIKHVSTRWLSLEHCVNRMLSQWDALNSYFSSIRMQNTPAGRNVAETGSAVKQ